MRAFLSGIPADSYAVHVAERIGLTDIPVKSNFALAFESAFRPAEPSGSRELRARARPPEKAVVEEAARGNGGRFRRSGLRRKKIDAASEARDGMTCARDRKTRGGRRLPALLRMLPRQGGGEDRRIRLLPDFAASALSGVCVVSSSAA